MPWKNVTCEEERRNFASEAKARKRPLAAICRACGISRKTGYKWLWRYEQDSRDGLKWRSCRPRERARWARRWREWLFRWRRKRPTWGAILLHDKMRRRWPRSQPPSARTLQRWLTAAGMTRPRRHRAQPGPVRLRPAHIVGDRPNDVWTVDFKGPMTPSGSPKLEPLTVFDLASRFGLMARQLAAKDCRCTRSAFQELFRRYGLPRAIQVDNGPPFGSEGPLGLTRLTVEWMLLGIHVQFGRPGCPQDNPEHERWHRTMQGDVVLTPTSGKETWQARLNRFLQIYNTDRVHHALGLKLPCDLYRPSRRRLLRPKPRRKYPANWTTIRLNAKGCLWWQKKVRHIGIAFGTQLLGLRPTEPGQCEVYLNHLLLGVLVATDQAGMRPIQLRRIQL